VLGGAGGEAEVVEHLPNKRETLSSKKKKERKKEKSLKHGKLTFLFFHVLIPFLFLPVFTGQLLY
jgi:hypothetical protein